MTVSIQFAPYSSFEQRCELERAERIVATLLSFYRDVRQQIELLGSRIVDVAASTPQNGCAPWSVRAIVGPKYRIWC